MLNRGAGSAERRAELEGAFSAAGIAVTITETEPAELAAAIRQAVAGGAPAIAVAGGDGTISTAADVLRGSATALLPVPMGTLNHFAGRYGIGSIEAAAQAWLQGTTAIVPVGVVNGRVFVNNASCGFYPHIVRHRDRMRRWLTKWPAAVIAAIRVLIKRPLMEIELQVHGHVIERRTAAVWVGIGRNSLRLPVPGDVEREGDVLEVVIPRAISRLRMLAAAIRVYTRLHASRYTADPVIETLRARRFVLRSDEPIDIALDGEEMRLDGRLVFDYDAKALRVFCLVCPPAR